MAEKNILCAYGIDVDAVAGWLGSYGGADSPDDISRGLFAGEVGSPRLLTLFERYGLKTTWFIPGHSLETFPEQMQMVVDAGHEIGIHGYTHENPIAMTPEQEEAVLVKCIDLVERISGKRPTGYVAPWWEFSRVTNELLLKHGIKYDHSLMHDDQTLVVAVLAGVRAGLRLVRRNRRGVDELRPRPAAVPRQGAGVEGSPL